MVVDDVDAVHASAVEQGFEIAYPLHNEEGGFGGSCFASRVAPSLTSCRIYRPGTTEREYAVVLTRVLLNPRPWSGGRDDVLHWVLGSGATCSPRGVHQRLFGPWAKSP